MRSNLELIKPILDAPRADQIEISLFGPSYGECVVVHAGHGVWFVVDSCKVPGSGRSRPLEYFKSIGVDPAIGVKKIIATHWHGDHIGGLNELLQNCPNSDFIVSGAVFCKDFLTLIRLYDNAKFGEGSDIKEYSQVLKTLLVRKKQPILAREQTLLWNRSAAGRETAQLVALAPANTEVIKGLQNISQLAYKRVLPDTDQNEHSVVLWLQVENAVALLGGDLVETGNKECGWSAIILSDISRPNAQIFKVPHHGSSTAHNPKIWTDLLTPRPPVMIAPWRKGKHALPTKSDIERLQNFTDNLFITSIPQNKKKLRPIEIQRTVDSRSLNIRLVDESLGHVRLRANYQEPNPNWETALFNGARKIEGKMAKSFPK